ncbi:PQQ-dependent sugar dehydrogenase [Glacieibacterium megasporae]|uniref:PQQ-dependent sugar dehydrogenase n=1 Tax=Glacieibacterium megasporae TaxID=2835787 RepID=UPI001C1DF480|nr:sorbosone dehydrogenase family protein [Polymorphobacter megasporae]UAJ10159.1 sorbosone dehydrogenase family protein [Polymorphobacter megasporae]
MRHLYPIALAALALSACGEKATLPVASGMGANPSLPAPNATLLPTVNVASVQRWAAGAKPVAGPGLQVAAFAEGLDHPRWLYVLPNGDVLVAETNSPPKPEDSKGIKGWVQGLIMGRAGATVASPNRITLLRDTKGTGVADVKTVFLKGLNSPFGMALVGNDLYIADTDAVLKFAYTPGATAIATPGTKVVDLPAGLINHHWTKNILASRDGATLYATVGSNSNVGDNGLAAETGRAAIWAIDLKTGTHRIFASGLRNPNGMGWEPASGKLWTAVNERDEIGSDLVPDYMTSVTDGGFYGWPFSYYGQNVDVRVNDQRPDLVARAIKPDYALGPHTASLGLTFAKGDSALPAAYADGAFVGQHGSWNRKPFSGYKVIFVPFAQGVPSGPAVDVLTGFLTADGKAQGRPVGVTIDAKGGLLVADDVGNKVWRVTGAAQTASR